ncbi:MAG: hypothetical protein AAB361_00935 [Patescibacteria group bacterium]
MAKKIYDIKPPKLVDQDQEKIEDFLEKKALGRGKKERKKRALKGPTAKRKKKTKGIKNNNRILLKKFSVGAVIFLAILLIYLFFKLPKAEVSIWPKTDLLSFKETIIADTSVVLADFDNKVIPAQYLKDEIESSEEFLATGNGSNEGKAGGTITIYNKCDFFKPVILKIGTHFISDSNKYFKILSKATVPSAVKSGGKIIPGSVDIEVEAAEGGESFNIKPANFSVPKFAGTVYYYCIYAQSKTPMSGGFASAVKKITEDDIQSAKEFLNEKALKDVENFLKSKISEDYILADGAISSEIVSGSSNTKAGVTADKFIYTAKASASCLVFKKSDLEKFIKDYIISQMPDYKILLEESINTTYNTEVADIEGGKITVNIEFSAKIYSDIDKNSLAYLLRRKTGDQINETINNNLGDKVSKVKVNLWPFWVTKSPKSQKAIMINLKFD